jgi:hypothetical protein
MGLFDGISKALQKFKNVKNTIKKPAKKKSKKQKASTPSTAQNQTKSKTASSSTKTLQSQKSSSNSSFSPSKSSSGKISSGEPRALVRTNPKSSKPFSSKITQHQARSSNTFSSTVTSGKTTNIKMTKDGLEEAASQKILASQTEGKTDEEIEAEFASPEEESVESEAESASVIDQEPENSAVSFAFIDAEATRKEIFVGPKELELSEAEKPKILAVFEEDKDKNGSPESLNLIIRKLQSDDENAQLRVIAYDIYRKSVFEQERFERISVVEPTFLSFPSQYVDSLRDMGLDPDHTFLWKDKTIKPGKVYAYKVMTRYDNNPLAFTGMNVNDGKAVMKSVKSKILENLNQLSSLGGASSISSREQLNAIRSTQGQSGTGTSSVNSSGESYLKFKK